MPARRSNLSYRNDLVSRRSGPKLLEWASTTQQSAFEWGPSPLLLSGGFGSGKTICATRKALFLSDMFPGNRGLIARSVHDKLKKTTMKTFYKDCPPEAYRFGGRRNDNEKILELNPRMCEDGQVRRSEILFLHLDAEGIESILRGIEINWFLLDQSEEMPESTFDTLLTRLGRWDQAYVPSWIIEHEKREGREWKWWNTETGEWREGAKPIPPTYAMMTCNPDTELHWLYKRFHEKSKAWQQDYRAKGYKIFHFNSLDNKFLPAQNRQHMLAQPEAFQRRFVRGEWGNPDGTIHDISTLSLIDGTKDVVESLRHTCTWYRILDHGGSSPTCCAWVAVDKDGNVIFVYEYYEPNKLISEHRKAIYERTVVGADKMLPITMNIADPSIFAPSMQKHEIKYSVADEYMDTTGLYDPKTSIVWTKGNNDEMGTRDRISEYLLVDPERINPFTRQKGSPRLFFMIQTAEHPHGCVHIHTETQAQRKLEIGTEDGNPIFSDERNEDIPDHGYDTVRYMIASRPADAPSTTVSLSSQFSINTVRARAHKLYRNPATLRAIFAAAKARGGVRG